MSGAKVLVVDAGGRGNAIAHSFARSPLVERVYVAPGNAGSSMMEKCEIALNRGNPIKEISDLATFAKEEGIDLTFVGPEGYLSDGIVNVFSREGLEIVGNDLAELGDVKPGEGRIVEFRCRIVKTESDRRSKFMVAVTVNWGSQSPKDKFVTFAYVGCKS